MKYTNNHSLPEAIVRAVNADSYDRGRSDITVTELIGPPLQRILRREHDEDLVEDVADRMYSLLGQAGHVVLERAAHSELAETRLYADVSGWTVGGQLDNLHLSDGVLSDYKFTSVYSLLYGEKPEWTRQLNCLAQLVIENGGVVNKLQIVVLARDWSATRAKERGYPKSPVQVVEIPLWLESERMLYLMDRVKLHQGAELAFANGDTVLECNKEERWERDPKFALMKKGNKRAVKLYEEEADAQVALVTSGTNHYIEVRPGERVRCERYCVLSKCGVCPYYKIQEEEESC